MVIPPDHLGSHFPSKFDEKIDAKIDDEKVMKIDEKTIRKLIYIFIFFETYVHKKRIFRKRLMCVNHMNPRVKHVSARVRPKIRKSENEKNCTNNIQKMKRKLVCWKHEKSSKRSSKMEPKSRKNPSQNRCRNLMRKRSPSRSGLNIPRGQGGTTNQQDYL